MAQPLSWSLVTFGHKFIAPWASAIFAAGCFYTMALAPALSLPGALDAAPLLRVTLVLGAGATAWYAFSLAARLVSIEVDNHNLFLSDFHRRATIPLAAVSDVTEENWLPHHPVTIDFERDTPFGRRVTFLPDMTDQWLRFAPHPVVAQLENAVRAARDSEEGLLPNKRPEPPRGMIKE
jgi:hypothetical protein